MPLLLTRWLRREQQKLTLFFPFFLLSPVVVVVVVVADLKKMLAPGFSLSSLARTVGLAESKFIFPYGVLRGYGEALDEPTLPPHGPRWFDVLRQRVTEEEEVAEAHETFRRLGCTSVREYLEAYLRMDLRLLVASSHRLYDKFTELTGVPPVDSDKSTLSSYSMYCSQLFLASRGRPGSFCNNNPMLYAIIRSSLRGGLTLVARSSVNRGEEEGINEGLGGGLVPEPARRPKSLHYLDVSGLYSAAGAYVRVLV